MFLHVFDFWKGFPMPNPAAHIYTDTSPKGRRLLAALLSGDDLTRRQLAARIGQRRLYPHDDHALHRLESLNVVYVTVTQLRDEMARAYDDDSFYRRREIYLYVRLYRYSLNMAYAGPLADLLARDGLYSPPQGLGRSWTQFTR
jgi:hypothetical protein